MREILFRGKAINRVEGREYRSDYKNGDWVYGLVTRLYYERYQLPAEMTNTKWIEGIEVDYKTIGQFTGLTDKNGMKIFEGDILEFDAYGKHFKGHVEIMSGNASVVCKNACPFLDDAIEKYGAQIIGNIHDNPELIETEG